MSKNKAREYTRAAIRRLDTLYGNECGSPDCTNKLVARDGLTIISKICHIEAASEKGPRFNPNMDDDDRRHFNNLILLCDECHLIVDNKENEDRYPVALLKKWKKDHEDKKTYSIFINKPLMLNSVVDAISKIDFDDVSMGEKTDLESQPYNILDKINYNNIIRNWKLIDEYKVFYTKINSLYQTLEEQGSIKKSNVLRNIRDLYLKISRSYIIDDSDVILQIRKNADKIIEDIQEELITKIECQSSQYGEDISFAISVIVVDAFIRCKILEEPVNS